MSINHEIEFKQVISETQFNQMLHHFKLNMNQAKMQENHYFDTKIHTLAKNGQALRIRQTKSYEMTLKVPTTIGLLEYNTILNDNEALAFINKPFYIDNQTIKEVEKLVDIDDLVCLASLKTYRIEIDYKGGLLVFDKSDYGIIDYEIEYEVSSYDEGQVIFNELLEQFNIKSTETVPKIMRAMRLV